jgi:hypothetical protein
MEMEMGMVNGDGRWRMDDGLWFMDEKSPCWFL